jgi:hypothetical protein
MNIETRGARSRGDDYKGGLVRECLFTAFRWDSTKRVWNAVGSSDDLSEANRLCRAFGGKHGVVCPAGEVPTDFLS